MDDRTCECKNESGRCRHHAAKDGGCGMAWRLHAAKDDRKLIVCIPCAAALGADGWRLRQDRQHLGRPR